MSTLLLVTYGSGCSSDERTLPVSASTDTSTPATVALTAPSLPSAVAPTTTPEPTTTAAAPTTAGPATTTLESSTVDSSNGHFVTLPPGSALPSDDACRAAVRPTPENRPDNDVANHTVGTNSQVPGVTGNFTGTTDEIIQWVACKWGIDEDIVRSQIAKESWWHQSNEGDYSNDPNVCHPEFRTTIPCPESIGIAQVRYQYHLAAFGDHNAIKSSAYNLDYTYYRWRSCYNGNETWLNQTDRGEDYAAGDVWGCVGLWFAGRWHTQPAEEYIAAVQDYLAHKVWLTSDFQHG